MKKLYVLVFLIMFMGKIFCLQDFDPKRIHFHIRDTNYFYTQDQAGIEKDYVRFTDMEFVENKEYYSTLIRKYLDLYKTDLLNISKFLKASGMESNLIKHSEARSKSDIDSVELRIERKMLKDNPWNTLAPKAFAELTGLTESDLKPSVFKDIGKTGEQKFILNLQKQLIKKAIDKSTADETRTKLLKMLSQSNKSLPVGIGKTIDELQEDLSAALTKSKVKLSMPAQTEIHSFSSKQQPKPSEVPAQTQSTVDPRAEQSQQNILQAAQQGAPTQGIAISSSRISIKPSSSPTVDPRAEQAERNILQAANRPVPTRNIAKRFGPSSDSPIEDARKPSDSPIEHARKQYSLQAKLARIGAQLPPRSPSPQQNRPAPPTIKRPGK